MRNRHANNPARANAHPLYRSRVCNRVSQYHPLWDNPSRERACRYAILRSHTGMHVHGSDYPTRDGTAIRDYTHVNDIADAHLLGLDYLRDGSSCSAFNLWTG